MPRPPLRWIAATLGPVGAAAAAPSDAADLVLGRYLATKLDEPAAVRKAAQQENMGSYAGFTAGIFSWVLEVAAKSFAAACLSC